MINKLKYPLKARLGKNNGNYSHGLSNHPMRGIWKCEKSRCENINDNMYYLYGARGIKCEWSLEEACKWYDNNPKPYESYSVDRINNDGNYNSENVRWASLEEQQQNTRIKSNNTTGFKGIARDNTRNTFIVYHKGKLKRFKELETAINYKKLLVLNETLPMSELITSNK